MEEELAGSGAERRDGDCEEEVRNQDERQMNIGDCQGNEVWPLHLEQWSD